MNIKLTIFAAMATLLMFSSGALAAKPPDAGNGGGGNEPPDFGDLIILYRDDYGVPELTSDLCQQPIAFPSQMCASDCIVGGYPDPTVGVVAVLPETCAIMTGCAACTQEVDFGRINEARSPDEVFEAQLEDAVFKLATADCRTLDPAGRLVASTVVDGDVPEIVSATIDSPLQNLAMYRQLVREGTLNDAFQPPTDEDPLIMAARGLGAASDKTGKVNVDMVAYINQIMGLTEPGVTTILGDPICQYNWEEVMGVPQLVNKCYLNYGAYGYARTGNFSTDVQSLPYPAYIPDDTSYGWFEYLSQVPDSNPPMFRIVQGPILEAVFGIDPGFTEGNIGGFAQAVDDTRAVIDFMHNWAVPDEFVTSLKCEDSGAVGYDVSISDVSGLQVPTRYVAGTEREIVVTIANAGPDAASGTVTVSAVTTIDDPVAGFPWSDSFTDLAEGTAASWTVPIMIDLGYATTITWTASVEAADDVNPLNNTVTVDMQVRLTGGGGGH